MDSRYEIVHNSSEISNDSSLSGSHFRNREPIIISPNNPRTAHENTSLLHTRMKHRITNLLSSRNLFVDFLTIAFGIGTWIGINSTFVQLPLLVLVAPESWNLASYVVVIIQIANIGPLLYTIIQKVKAISDAYIIYGLLSLGVVAAISMALFYDVTAFFWNAKRSVALLAIVFCFALVGCTSSVLFMPYMGRFREVYLITYLIGEGLSGFLPSIVALAQGVGGNSVCVPNNSSNPNDPPSVPYTPPPNFGTRAFFFIIFALFVSSLISFLLLDRLPTCKKEHAAVKISHGNKYVYHDPAESDSATTPSTVNQEDEDSSVQDREKQPTTTNVTEIKLSMRSYRAFLILLGVICMFANGIFPSIMVYSTNHYGNVVYHFAATLSSIANPVACFLAVFLPHRSIRNIILLCLLTIPLSTYAIVTAAMSPSPPLVGLLIGEILVVVVWTLIGGLYSYIRLSLTTVFRLQGGKALVWVGTWTQIGSFVGAVISFILVNFTGIFVNYNPCD